ncbi:MAG TPA: ABC transporter permease [Anaeromyxobacter sp.]|nr:ABC transporter permease [Anaeromyxobacter sp.]
MAIAIPSSGRALLGRLRTQALAPLLALLALAVISALISPYFLQVQNLLNILRQVSYAGIIALGMTFVIIGGGIDLSVGSMMALVGAMAIGVLNAAGGDRGGGPGAIALAAAAAVLFGLVLGSANGIAITKGGIAPFIVTLGTMAIFRSLTLWYRDAGEARSTSELYGGLGMSTALGIPTPVWVWLVLAVLLNVLLNNTRYGRHVCAVGSNEKVAQYAAIRIDRVRFVTYAIVGLMVGVSAVLLSARLNSISSTNFGVNLELDAIAAVIIGGTPMTGGRGSIWGTVMGAIILGIINNMLNMAQVSPYLQGTVKGLVIIAAVFIQRKL